MFANPGVEVSARRLDDAKEHSCSETLYDPVLIARSRRNMCRVFTPLIGGATTHNAGKQYGYTTFFSCSSLPDTFMLCTKVF